MQITKKLFFKTFLSISLIGISGLISANARLISEDEDVRVKVKHTGLNTALPESENSRYSSIVNTNKGEENIQVGYVNDNSRHDNHLKEHGGQIYQMTKLENEWMVDDKGSGNLGVKLETLIGTDENRIFIKSNLDKSEGDDPKYDAYALYSRNVAPFWDVQIGVRYSEDRNTNNSRVDGVVGVLGLAPYFFETQIYLYGGENNYLGASLEAERDFLLTQKLITQPYIEVDAVFSDKSDYASKTGLSELKMGLKTRYEITKQIRPFLDLAYQYEKGQKLTYIQQASASEKGWLYGAGIEFVF